MARSVASTYARSASSLQACHHGQALDLVIQVRLQEGVIVSDRHAAIGIAIRAEHKAVCQETGPAKDFPLILGNQPQRANPMEKPFPQFEIVDIRRGGAVQPIAANKKRHLLLSLRNVPLRLVIPLPRDTIIQ